LLALGEQRTEADDPSMIFDQRGTDRLLDVLLDVGPLVSFMGLAGLFATIGMGFEEPNRVMFVASGGLLLAGPLAVVVHAACTRHLTPARRRTWLRAFCGARAVSAMSRYLQLSRWWAVGRTARPGR
jgi:hypothetical protein